MDTVLSGSHTGTEGPLMKARLIPHSSKMMGDQGVTQDYRLEHKKSVRLGLQTHPDYVLMSTSILFPC